jgi:hypothetical protein
MERIGFGHLEIVEHTKPGHWNDPDMIEVGNGGMTADEYRLHMSLWCMLLAPLMAGNDLRTMTEETKSILMNPDAIALDQDRNPKPVERPRSGRQERSAGAATHRQRGRGRALQPRRSRGGNRLPVGQPAVRIGPAGLAPFAGAGSVEARSRAGYR